MAGYRIKGEQLDLATFSFDGEDANTIVLSHKYDNTQVNWTYSLDGGKKWIDANKSKKVTLTREQILSLSEQNGIKVQMKGTNFVFDIPLKKAEKVKINTVDSIKYEENEALYVNDNQENQVLGWKESTEWSFSSDFDSEWTRFSVQRPDLSGDKIVYVRNGYTGHTIAGENMACYFTQDSVDVYNQYISVDNMKIKEYFFDEKNQKNISVQKSIDGRYDTCWRTDKNVLDKHNYIVIELDKLRALSSIEYVPGRGLDGNKELKDGRILDIKVSVSQDNENWVEVVASQKMSDDANTKVIKFAEPVIAKYVKIEALETRSKESRFVNAGEFRLFEDSTILVDPTNNVGLIVGIVIGVLVVLVGIGVGVYFVFRKKKQNDSNDPDNNGTQRGELKKKQVGDMKNNTTANTVKLVGSDTTQPKKNKVAIHSSKTTSDKASNDKASNTNTSKGSNIRISETTEKVATDKTSKTPNSKATKSTSLPTKTASGKTTEQTSITKTNSKATKSTTDNKTNKTISSKTSKSTTSKSSGKATANDKSSKTASDNINKASSSKTSKVTNAQVSGGKANSKSTKVSNDKESKDTSSKTTKTTTSKASKSTNGKTTEQSSSSKVSTRVTKVTSDKESKATSSKGSKTTTDKTSKAPKDKKVI